MKFSVLLVTILGVFTSTLSAQNMEYVYDQDEVFFYGLDFSHAKMIGEDFDNPKTIVNRYVPAWNQILFDEKNKFDVEELLSFKSAYYDLSILNSVNKDIDYREFRINRSHKISREKFFESVRSYDLPQSSGLGLSIFVETFHEFNDECSVYYVFFDIASRDLVVIENVTGKTGGVGFRNNWANAIHDTMRKWKKQTYRKIALDKIELLPEEDRKKYYYKLETEWAKDDIDHFDAKIEKKIRKRGREVWAKGYYKPLPIPSNTLIRQIPISKENSTKQVKPTVIRATNKISSVDVNIPKIGKPNPYRFALIIGNEDYQSHQPTLSKESNVDYANRDAEIFKQYAQNIMGVPEENTVYLLDAQVVELNRALIKMNKAIELSNGKAEIIIYYAGHGFPDQNTKDPYLIPVDVSANDLKYAFKLTDLYKSLTQYESKRITVFLDACFSGGARNQGLMTARGIKIVPKEGYLHGNITVFSACSGTETAQPYHNEQHGLFTYFLLKKLQETKGDLTYEELYNYLKENVGIKSVFVNESEQTPEINSSPSVGEEWKNWKLN
ncbi:MAG: caspase family protein [Salibacteraceae bacterium]